MRWLLRLFDKSGVLATVTAAMGCASCFPALGSLASFFGLAFLAQYEGLFINTLLPLFAWLVIIINTVIFFIYRRWLRFIASITGPGLVLLSLYPLWQYGWSTYLFYSGLLIMLIVAGMDIISPARKACAIKNSTEGVS